MPPLGPTTAEQLHASLSTHPFRQLGLWWPPRRLVAVRLGLRRGQAPACRLGPGRVLRGYPAARPRPPAAPPAARRPGPASPEASRGGRRGSRSPGIGPRPPARARGPSSPAPAESVPVDPARTGHRRLRVDFRRLGVDCTLNGRGTDEPAPPCRLGLLFIEESALEKGIRGRSQPRKANARCFTQGPGRLKQRWLVHCASSVVRHCAAKAAG